MAEHCAFCGLEPKFGRLVPHNVGVDTRFVVCEHCDAAIPRHLGWSVEEDYRRRQARMTVQSWSAERAQRRD